MIVVTEAEKCIGGLAPSTIGDMGGPPCIVYSPICRLRRDAGSRIYARVDEVGKEQAAATA
jgi:hypothetical protein